MFMLEKLIAQVQPVVTALGYELLHIEQQHEGDDTVLRAYIDAPGGINIDDCAVVSQWVSAVLDEWDAESTAYRLEISSPGLDRPLVKPEHFQQQLGKQAKIIMASKINGRRKWVATMVAADDNTVVVEVDGEQHRLPYHAIESARIEPIF